MEEKIITAINAEIEEHAELRRELGTWHQDVMAHSAKLEGMIEVLSMVTGKKYRQTREGLVEVK